MPVGAQLILPIEQVDPLTYHLIVNTILVEQKFNDCMLWIWRILKAIPT
jgi:hypothetical protein